MTQPLPHLDLMVLNPEVLPRLGRIQHTLFDFDGTLSLIRQGWEGVMIPMMVRCICGDLPPDPGIVQEVNDYVDRTTGILTIIQMEWLAEAVRRYGLAPKPLSASQYKALYIELISEYIKDRLTRLQRGDLAPASLTVRGGEACLRGLAQHGVALYLASGTDHEFVVAEARSLELDSYFGAQIYGALNSSEANGKERIIRRIITKNHLQGEELLVVGDGPVEMREAVACGAIAMGVASDEAAGFGWNLRKVRRLEEAGADLLIPDFGQAGELLAFLLDHS